VRPRGRGYGVAIFCGLLARPKREQRPTTRRMSTTSEFSAVRLAPHDTRQGRRGGAVANLRAASAPRRALHRQNSGHPEREEIPFRRYLRHCT